MPFVTDLAYIPHGHCYLWQPNLVGLHVLGDGLTALSYYSIPLLLLFFVKKRQDVPFPGLLVLFGLFILACGTTHVLEIWTLWRPDYWVSGFCKLFTGLISFYTMTILVRVIPQALALPSPAQLEQANQALLTEIHERQTAEANLKSSESRFRTLLQKLRVGVLVQDLHLQVLTTNAAALTLLNVTHPQSLSQILTTPSPPMLPAAIIHEDGSPYTSEQIPAVRVLANQTAVNNIVMGIARPTQSTRWLLVDADPQRDDQGQITQVISTFTDITDRREGEEERRVYTQQLQMALRFESMLKRITDKVRDSLDKTQILQGVVAELTAVLQVPGCVIVLESGECHYSQDESAAGTALATVIAALSAAPLTLTWEHFPEVAAQLQHDPWVQACDVTTRLSHGPVCFLVHLLRDEQLPIGALWILNRPEAMLSPTDTRLIAQVVNQCAIAIRQARLYAAVQSQVENLERLSRLKDDFLSTVSHELRTPISTINMATHLLKLTALDDRQTQYLSILERECQREIALINNLLDLQQLEAATYPLEHQAIALRTWLPEIMQPFLPRFETHQQSFHYDDQSTLALLISDSNCLKRILVELLTNAIKYTASGQQIQLLVQDLPPRAKTAVGVQLIVQNQASLPPTELPHLFEKFYRVPDADPWKHGGTGLGLALVQRLAGHLHGSITATCQAGWVRFALEVPSLPPH